MTDLLYQAAMEYQKLQNIKYKVIVGRKGKAYTILLHFPEESFFHLAGLQHLTDITFPSRNKERIYKEILNHEITVENLKKSVFYESWFIEERLAHLHHLQDMFESNVVTYLIHQQEYVKYTSVKADYLCEYTIADGTLYLFTVLQRKFPKFENECRGCSFFKKHKTDYTNGTAKTTVLLIEKIVDENTEEIYRSLSYKDI